MVFGQASGPPASSKQVQELLALLKQVGHSDFRDARGPMGFTQRQAAGKFTREEVATFIAQLQENASEGSATEVQVRAVGRSNTAQSLRRVPAKQLAAELRDRGWTVTEP